MYISRSITSILRLAQLLFASTITALLGHILSTSYYNQIPRTAGNAAEVNFTMFCSIFSLFSLLFLIPTSWKYWQDSTIVLRVAAALDGLNFLWYLSDGIAMAAALQVHSCSNKRYTEHNKITQTSPNTKVRCREAQAATAFVWMMFVLFGVTLGFSLAKCFGGDFATSTTTSNYRASTTGRNAARGRGAGAAGGSPRFGNEEVSGGPMAVAPEMEAELRRPEESVRRYGRRHGSGSVNGGYWNTDTEDGGDSEATFGFGGRVVNVPVGGPEVADDEGVPGRY